MIKTKAVRSSRRDITRVTSSSRRRRGRARSRTRVELSRDPFACAQQYKYYAKPDEPRVHYHLLTVLTLPHTLVLCSRY